MSKLQEKPSALKSEHPELQKLKIVSFFLCLWVLFALLDLDPDCESGSWYDPGTQLNPDPIRIRIRIRIHGTAENYGIYAKIKKEATLFHLFSFFIGFFEMHTSAKFRGNANHSLKKDLFRIH